MASLYGWGPQFLFERRPRDFDHAAARHHTDLVVMGARGLTGLRGLMVGSVTQRVVRYGATSVLVTR